VDWWFCLSVRFFSRFLWGISGEVFGVFFILGSVHCFRLKSSHAKGSAGATEGWCLSRNKHLQAGLPTAHAAGEEVPSKAGFVKPYL